MCTLSCLQQHPRSTIVADEDATLELKVKTVKVWVSRADEMVPWREELTFECSTLRVWSDSQRAAPGGANPSSSYGRLSARAMMGWRMQGNSRQIACRRGLFEKEDGTITPLCLFRDPLF